MKSERYEMRMAEELLAAIDSQRGQLSRAAWITKVLEQTLAGQGPGDTSSVTSPRGSGSAKRTAPTEPPVSARASWKPVGHTRLEGVGTPLPKIAPRRQPR